MSPTLAKFGGMGWFPVLHSMLYALYKSANQETFLSTSQTELPLRRANEMKHYADHFHMTPEQSIFLAKKKWDENVYCGMRMENRNITFPQTKTIHQGVNVPNVQLDDIQAVLNMRDAWRFLLATVAEPLTFEYWCKLNGFIARNEALDWGKQRNGSVGISGTDYMPPVPDEKRVREEFNAIITFRCHCHRKSAGSFCVGHTGPILLGQQ